MARTFKQTKTMEDWRPIIRAAKRTLNLNDSEWPDAVIMAIMHVESGGRPGAKKKGATQFNGLMQQGTNNARDIGKENSKFAHNNGPAAIMAFLQWQNLDSVKSNHGFNPDYIALVWKGGGSTLRTYRSKIKSGGQAAGTRYLAGKYGGSPIQYLKWFNEALEVWKKFTNEDIPYAAEGVDFSSSPSNAGVDTIYGKERTEVTLTPFELASYITPEELRKGIVAQIYHINEWHLAILANKDTQDANKEKASGDEDDGPSVAESRANLQGGSTNNDQSKVIAGSSLVDERRRYVQALVEAEFYRRRYASRSVPVITGPFNPYPVTGFTGLIMNPGRPIIGYVQSVIHSINVEAGSATTSVNMSHPRYWDEGEVWYWFGGESSEEYLMKSFPQWHNSLVIAENNTDKFFDRVSDSNLDEYYDFMIGSQCVEYRSNNAGKVSVDKIRSAIKDRNPGDLEVNEETLQISEYNSAIASLDEDGKFAIGTLAWQFYGSVRPYDVNESNTSVESQIDYVERYGVREEELLVDFLGNEFTTAGGRLVVTGPTFGSSDKINSIQSQVIDYIKDLERRTLEGGV